MNLIVEVRGSRCTDAGAAELVQFIRARACWENLGPALVWRTE